MITKGLHCEARADNSSLVIVLLNGQEHVSIDVESLGTKNIIFNPLRSHGERLVSLWFTKIVAMISEFHKIVR